MPFAGDSYQRVSCTSGTSTIRLSQGQAATVELTVRDDDGNAVDLNTYAAGPDPATVRMAVSQMLHSSNNEFELDGTVVDIDNGVVTFAFTPEETAKPGIFVASVGVFDVDILQHQQMFYMEFMPTNFSVSTSAPITIPEVRMDIMDTCPDANYLLDDLEFTDGEIIHAMRKAVDTFNEALPPIGGYTYDSFPFRALWFKGTNAYLLKMIAHKYRRNQLDYLAGGVSIRDQAKSAEYYSTAKQEEAEFLESVRQRKVAINIGLGFGSVGRSPYGLMGL